jgi:adenylate cyclase
MKQSHWSKHPAFVSLVGSVVTCLVVAVLASARVLETAELQAYDWMANVQGFAAPPREVAIVDFDDATMEGLKVFPIPRDLLAQVIEKVSSGEPALIGLDVLLTERRDPDGDQRLVRAISRAGNVIIPNAFAAAQLPAAEPLPEFREAALDVAFVNYFADEDSRYRRVLLWNRTKEFTGVSLAVALVQNYVGKPIEPARPGYVRMGATQIALDGTSANSMLLAMDFDPHVFKERIVLVGQSSSKGKDLFQTPYNRYLQHQQSRRMLSGTELHAAAVATLLTGNAVHLLGAPALWAINFLVIWAVLFAVLSVRPYLSILLFFGGIAGTYLAAQYLFDDHQMWLKWVSSSAGVVLALPAGLGYRFLEERRMKALVEAERRELMGLFGRYVSEEVAQEIWERRSELVLAGEERVATVLFSDIRNFTALSAGRPSGEVLAWLNEYFTAMSEVVQRNGGYLNKFIGDGMLVLFGVPLSSGAEDDACRAVQAAVEMVQRVEELNARQKSARPKFKIGVGIHTGPLTVGNVGARDRLEYSVIGETVNLSSRLESLNKEFNTSIVLSPQTRDLVKDRFAPVRLGQVTVRGFSEAIQVYTVPQGAPPEAKG